LSGLSWLRSWYGSMSRAAPGFVVYGIGAGSDHFLMTWDYSSVVYLQQ
jgi:hypothetical protein